MLFRLTLQLLVRQSADGHDSEHRGPAVLASTAVSWDRGDDAVLCVCVGLNSESSRRLCRRLDKNSLAGTIPSTVGQLSSLSVL
jgi:hypothetical protein